MFSSKFLSDFVERRGEKPSASTRVHICIGIFSCVIIIPDDVISCV